MTIHDVVGRLAAAGIRVDSVGGRLIAKTFDGSTIGPESIKLLISYKAELLARIHWLQEHRPNRVPAGEVRHWKHEPI